MTYRVSQETVGGRTVCHLHDDATGASASVLPSFGFNLFDLRLPVAGQVRPIVVAEPGWAANPGRAGRNGTPVLFPFPNRIRDARYVFEGKQYQLVANKPPNAIHGFAIEANWEVVSHQADDSGASITGRFQISRNRPEDLARWPADAILEMRYTLAGQRLRLDVSVTNPSNTLLPWGFGIHPYFRLPFDPDGDRARTRIILPASQYWVLQDSLPTGERRPVDDRLDFRQGKPIDGLDVDDVLTGLLFEGEQGTCRLVDDALGAEFRLGFDRTIRELVVFTPPVGGGVIAVEPYTQTTDAIHLQTIGIEAGLRILPAGGSDSLLIFMETSG